MKMMTIIVVVMVRVGWEPIIEFEMRKEMIEDKREREEEKRS